VLGGQPVDIEPSVSGGGHPPGLPALPSPVEPTPAPQLAGR
jgi:hypothetical protein